MKNNTTKIDLNLRNLDQNSASNPGWKGKGEPTFKPLIKKFLRNIKSDVLNIEFNLLINHTKELIFNLKTFLFSKKDSVFCPCCNWEGRGFICTSNEKRVTYHSKCPNCDSRSRHRGLLPIINKYIKNSESDFLFFAPENIILNHLKKHKTKLKIKTTDFFSLDVNYPKEDIQNLTFKDDSYDYIMSNHVIEHVPQDDKAFSEISRILKKDGKAIITIPGDYHLNKTIEFEKTDFNGHYRHYGLDVIKKMEKYFTNVEIIDMSINSKLAYKIRKNDLAFICYK